MRLPATVGLLLLVGCDDTPQTRHVAVTPQISADSPFKYHGNTLRFPKGSVDSRIEEGQGPGPWARLYPRHTRYYIDLGRTWTGKVGPSGYELGYQSYSGDASRMNLGDGYILYCQPVARRTPAFSCAALLRSLPFAAIQFKYDPSSADEARALVDEAETFLTGLKGE